MPGPLVGNPLGAFGETGTFAQAPQSVILDAYNGGTTTIPVNTWVGVDLTGTGAHVFAVTQGLHGADAETVIGIALDAMKAGASGRVVIAGPAPFIAGTGGVTAGDMLSIDTNASHDGQLLTASATPEVGAIIGMTLTTTAVGVVGSMWVFKS